MSLFSSLQMAGNALSVNQVALQVVGQNIANVNTQGYLREEILLAPAPTQNLGNYSLGMGVKIQGIIQVVDDFVEQRLRGAVSDMWDSDILSQTYTQLERLIGETTDLDLSTSLNDFFSSISDVLNQPESMSVRHLVTLKGETLSQDFQNLAGNVQLLRENLNDQVIELSSEINRLTGQIRKLNVEIAAIEGGSTSSSDAVGLRDTRMLALEELASLVDIKVQEQSSGAVSVYVGGEYLVFDGVSRQVEVAFTPSGGMDVASIQLADTDSPINATSGKLHGLITSRDEVLQDFLGDLDEYAATLAFEFNKVYSSGQGLSGYSEVSSTETIEDTDAALNEAGLHFEVTNGSFEILVYNEQTDTTERSTIRINLNGIDQGTSLDDVVDQLNAVSGVSASVDVQGQLTIASADSKEQIAFANDTSYFLAAMGINTFFTGWSAGTLEINQVVAEDASKFAASQNGIGVDTNNGVILAGLMDQVIGQNNQTLTNLYDTMVSNVTEGAFVANSLAESNATFEGTIRGQKLSISGVNLDEEAIKMMSYQRAYQANARMITAVDELFDILFAM